MKIILFDIDGTLLKAGGIVREAMGDALQKVFGTRGGIIDASFIGATDLGVVHELMGREGFSLEEIDARFSALIETYGPILAEKLATWDNFRLCPGIPLILERLQEDASMLGLVTGNCKPGAMVKLKRGGLTDYFTFGAYGDESSDRTAITRLAHERGENEAGYEIPRDQVILVGDSPNDIKAAHEYGIRVLAVYSGWTPKQELEELKPTWLYPDLADTEEILGLLLS
ncbi:HAD hydrolase-like protein [candidate division WOR-3 bacterium]|nr:HAD hydrolase-like protein [candidate division WOR-3 bacterium]